MNMNMNMDRDLDFKAGDILVYEADEGWLSLAIAILTDSKVSHTALLADINKENGKWNVIEMGLSGIAKNPLGNEESGRKVYHLRLDPEKDASRVVEVAERYLAEECPYDIPALIFLAGLLIYKKVRRTTELQKITDTILLIVCKELDDLINKMLDNKIGRDEVKHFICSQLVYQCYLDCGEEFTIKLPGALLSPSSSNEKTYSLAHSIEPSGKLFAEYNIGKFEKPEYDLQTLAEKLYKALTSETLTPLLHKDFLSSDSPAIVEKFLELVNLFIKTIGSDLPVDALFVTPADFLVDDSNLKKLPEIYVK